MSKTPRRGGTCQWATDERDVGKEGLGELVSILLVVDQVTVEFMHREKAPHCRALLLLLLVVFAEHMDWVGKGKLAMEFSAALNG